MVTATRESSSVARHAKTRLRLLEAAGEVFADRGFRDATVRDICKHAGTNVASINYHFGDKRKLYSEVLRHWYQLAFDKYPPTLGVTTTSTPAKRLHAFIYSFLLRILDKGKPAWFGKLMAREMIDPTHVLDERIQETIRPMWSFLGGILRDLAAGALSDEQLRHIGLSVVGQIVFHHHAKPVVSRVFPEQRYESEDIERLADHITKFSLAGIRALKRVGGEA